jgi:hypothetical protein
LPRSIPLLFLPLLAACQHFVKVDTQGSKPVFSWAGGGVATGLTVGPVLEDCEFDGPHSEDRVWWQITGEIKSPVTYGETPPGATVRVPPRPLTDACATWVVTATDQTMRGEATEFRLRSGKW